MINTTRFPPSRVIAGSLIAAIALGAAVIGSGTLAGADDSSPKDRDEIRHDTVDSDPTPAPAIANGRHLGSIEGAYVGPAELAFDDVDLFTGDDAVAAATDDGVDPGDIGDFYLRNVDPVAVSLAVSSDVVVTVVDCSETGCVEGAAITYDSFTTDLDESGRYWITVEDGAVVRIDQQYLP